MSKASVRMDKRENPSSDKPTKSFIKDNSLKVSLETHSKMLLSGKTEDKKDTV
jgi:hypothetical protein